MPSTTRSGGKTSSPTHLRSAGRMAGRRAWTGSASPRSKRTAWRAGLASCGSITNLAAVCTTRSRMVGIPSGRWPTPPDFGIITRLLAAECSVLSEPPPSPPYPSSLAARRTIHLSWRWSRSRMPWSRRSSWKSTTWRRHRLRPLGLDAYILPSPRARAPGPHFLRQGGGGDHEVGCGSSGSRAAMSMADSADSRSGGGVLQATTKEYAGLRPQRGARPVRSPARSSGRRNPLERNLALRPSLS